MTTETIDQLTNKFQNLIVDLEKSISDNNRVKPAVLDPATKVCMAWGQLKIAIDNLTTTNDVLARIEKKIDSAKGTPSYSDAVRKPVSIKTVIAKSRLPNITPIEVKESICNKLVDKISNCNSVTINSKGVAFNFNGERGKNLLIEAIADDPLLNENIEVYEPRPKCPTIKLCNIDYSVTEHDLIDTLIRNNPILQDADNSMKLLFSIKKRFYYDAVIVLSPHLFQRLMSNPETTLCAVWSASQAEEIFLVKKCGNCLCFDHGSRDCPLGHMKACRICSKTFSTKPNGNTSDFKNHIKNCESASCINCNRENLNPNHRPDDPSCPIYKRKTSAMQRITCYDSEKIIKFDTSSQQPSRIMDVPASHPARVITRSQTRQTQPTTNATQSQQHHSQSTTNILPSSDAGRDMSHDDIYFSE